MKKLTSCLVFILAAHCGFSQFHAGVELGGSNYVGAAINASYQLHFTKESKFFIAPQLGVGQIFFWDHPITLQGGLALGIQSDLVNSFEFNSTLSYRMKSLFYKKDPDAFTFPSTSREYLWFNSLDFRFKPQKIRYVIGAGFLMAASSGSGRGLRSNLDGIPMIKLGIGI